MKKQSRNRIWSFLRLHWLVSVGGLVILIALGLFISRLLPASESDMRRSVCRVSGRAALCVVSGKDTLVIKVDSVEQQGVWMNSHWWWPSCDGKVLTSEQQETYYVHGQALTSKSWRKLLPQMVDSVGSLIERKEIETKELDYYLRVHGVQDQGYLRIARYAELQRREADSLARFYVRLKSFKSSDSARLVRRYVLNVSWVDIEDSLKSVRCAPFISDASNTGQPMTLQTDRSVKPFGVYAVKKLPWGKTEDRHIISVALVPQNTIVPYHALLATGMTLKTGHHDIPELMAREGSPVFSRAGRYIGIICNHRVRR
ncbi:MAG: hypothetical protein WCS15_05040 [Prevotella sp.]